MTRPASSTAPLRLAVLISGSGRTLKNFIDLAAGGELSIDIRLVVSSSAKAGGLKFSEEAGIPTRVISRGDFPPGPAGDKPFGDAIFAPCGEAAVDYVAMAGFLKLAPVPPDFAGRVLNIHPALIPAFCGPGMYGHHVHEAALDAGVRVTGCTVHFVDNQYDHGPIIWQQPVPVFEDDSADTLAARVFEAEKEAYPHVLKMLAAGRIELKEGRVTIRKPERRRGSPAHSMPPE
jgi:phosphoribosylglycinamide formyltransferase-1